MSFLSRRAILLLGTFCLVPLLNFPRALLSDRSLFLRDIAMVWAPQVEAVVQQVGRGEFPAFDPWRGFGQPLFADPRAEVLYPPAWLHWVLPVERSYALFVALHLIIAALGAARLARRLIPEASLAALATAGLAYAASGPLLSLVSHWHHLAAAAWMPWILEKAETREGDRTPWLALSTLVLLQALAGSPDYSFTTFLLCLLRMLTRGVRPGTREFKMMGALVLGLLMGAVQLLPSLAFASEAGRARLPVGWALSPLHPAIALETVLPFRAETWPLRPEARDLLFYRSQVWMLSHYLGLSVWALAVVGLTRAGRWDRRFAAGSIALGLILALGVRNEWLQTLVAQLPLVSGLRFPTKHLAASSLGLSLLAAFGVMAPAPWPTRSRSQITAGLVASAIGVTGLFFWSTEAGVPFEPSALAAPLLSAASVLVLLIACRRPSSLRPTMFPALVVLDLLFANRDLNPTTPASYFRDRPPLSRVIPPGSRIYVSDYSSQARDGTIRLPPGPPYGLLNVPRGFARAESLSLAATWYLNPPTAGRFGYFGSFDLDILDFYRGPLQRTVEAFVTSRDSRFMVESLRRGSVEYVVTMDSGDLWNSLPLIHDEKPFFEAPIRVYKVTEPWPRARYETAQGDLAPGSPRVIELRHGRIRIETASSSATRLVVAVANDRGWRARMDDAEVRVSDNPMAFVSIPVEPGHHLVEFRYWPPWIEAGALISALGLAMVLTLAARRT